MELLADSVKGFYNLRDPPWRRTDWDRRADGKDRVQLADGSFFSSLDTMQRKEGSAGKVGIKLACTMGGEEGTIPLCFSYAGALFCHGDGFWVVQRKRCKPVRFRSRLLASFRGVWAFLACLSVVYIWPIPSEQRFSTCADATPAVLVCFSSLPLTDPAVLPWAANGDFEARGQQASPGDGGGVAIVRCSSVIGRVMNRPCSEVYSPVYLCLIGLKSRS
ncbi:hypothetical protein A9K55_003596 [Cordyceps militaris]|uniref:Uncharacterized protein n=1 Tax=Cordyceps militaris TaxID=73501 RepID=A0A2H4S5X3_CORMI|nr:hypothetical protein A9K55_003596 [Cordyceps militaris]